MEHIPSFIASIAILGILIFVHELGHFLVAKWRKVGVIEFALGFGKKIISVRYGETDYTLRLIPLGGYVRMAGDDPHTVMGDPDHPNRAESLLTGAENGNAAELERFKDPSCWFLKKGLWSRIAIVLAGPVFNLIFAWFLAVGSFSYFGKATDLNLPVIGGVFPGYPAEKSGIKEKDKVTEINGVAVATWVDLATRIKSSEGKEIKLLIERKSKEGQIEIKEILLSGTLDTADIELLSESSPDKKEASERSFKIGIVPELGREPVSFGEAFNAGTGQIWYLCSLTFRIFGGLIEGVVAPSKVLGGPIAVISGAAQSAKRGIESIIDFMILLSVSLFIFNLLPVPVLDGGHLMFFAIEGLRGKPLSLKWVAIANNVGMVLLLSLMAFALSNDIIRLL
jgi:regulator of sigma E protease